MTLDAHARPPGSMRILFKKWQKCTADELTTANGIIDFPSAEHEPGLLRALPTGFTAKETSRVFQSFLSRGTDHGTDNSTNSFTKWEVTSLPGLFIYPSLLPSEVQIELLDKLLHRDLSNQSHKSNLHLHYEIPYLDRGTKDESKALEQSFFSANPSNMLTPKDPKIHKPLTITQMLQRKLRWMTLGGQYDWTAKVYPSEPPPDFPRDIADLLKGLFPDVDAQAAIVNFYTPGDTLSVHRDVSEECDQGLISISIGCDALFIVGNEDGSQTATIRLRSGDVVLMSGNSRYAWHAVPRILPGTCPDRLQAWPATDTESKFDTWRGWIATKRINLNVRQMRT